MRTKTPYHLLGCCIGFCLGTSLASAAEPPDFSGSWTTYRGTPLAGAVALVGGDVKLKPEAEAARNDYLSITEGTDYSPGNACVGYGMPASMLGSGAYPMEIIQRPDQVFVIYEAHNEMRRFYLGDEIGDPHDFFPERNGYSTARWDGERLLVDTVRLKTQVDSRYPHSDQATIHEEYYLDTPQEDGTRVLVAELTMTDPAWLEEPFVTTKRWQEMPDYHVLSYECSEPKWLDEMQHLYDAAGLNMVQE
ncbi:MAG TPA: hypothetical protein VNR18_05300 [Hyphomicrobiales bacterium]|nr:hypothetical protein [Hyphomicrobiales bacterium]